MTSDPGDSRAFNSGSPNAPEIVSVAPVTTGTTPASELQDPDSTGLPTVRNRNLAWRSFQLLMQVVFCVWQRYRVRGLERLPSEGGALFLINHQSFLDPLLVGLPLRRPVSYLARDNLFRIPVVGTILRWTYVKPINREQATTASLRVTIDSLSQGYFCGIFPEGTRSRDGRVGEIKPGFIALIRRSRVPIYPIGIAGAHLAMGRGSPWFKPRVVRVVYGEPLDPEQVTRLCEKGREAELVAYVRSRIVQYQAEAEAWRQLATLQ